LLEKRGWDDRPGGVSVEILANGSDLTKLKFGEPETAPAFGSVARHKALITLARGGEVIALPDAAR
jgi:hypothetical protein